MKVLNNDGCIKHAAERVSFSDFVVHIFCWVWYLWVAEIKTGQSAIFFLFLFLVHAVYFKLKHMLLLTIVNI